MHTRHLTSEAGTPHLGVELLDTDLATAPDEDIERIGHLLAAHLVVVARGAHLSKERFFQICARIGTVHGTSASGPVVAGTPEGIDPDAESEAQVGYFYTRGGRPHLPGLIRVSGIRDEKGEVTGMFAEGELGWHTNHAGQRHPYPNVGLQAVEGTAGTVTDILECVTPYARLSDGDKARLDPLQIEYRWAPKAVTAGGSDVQDAHFRQNQVREGVGNALVQASPGGLRGFHFSEHLIARYTGLSDAQTGAVNDEVRAALFHDAFIYRHRWQDGDVVLFDQTVCLHRRLGDTTKRLLHRVAFGFDRILPDQPAYVAEETKTEEGGEY